MLGSNALPLLSNLRQYVIKYGSVEVKDFLNTILYECGEAGEAFSFVTDKEQDDSKFIPGLEELFESCISKECVVPTEQRTAYIKGFFRDLFNRCLNINNPGDTNSMNLCVYVPLWVGANEFENLYELLKDISGIEQKYNVDLFLLPYDLAFLFEKNDMLYTRSTEYAENTVKNLDRLLAWKKEFRILSHLLMMRNCNSKGLSLGLDQNSLGRIIGEFALLGITDYDNLFQVNAQDPNRPISALGISVLGFDKYYFVQYLLHKAYISILDREKVMQEEVDVNKVSNIAHKILSQKVSLFTDFYKNHIEPLLNDNVPQNQIIEIIKPFLDQTIAQMTVDFQSYIEDPALSLPEKKATLAQLLGEDDALLSGYLFNKKQLVLEDCSREVLDHFTDYNSKLAYFGLFEEYPDIEANEIKDYTVLSFEGEPQTESATNMLSALKQTRIQIRESTNYIRQKTKDLNDLNVQKVVHRDSFKRLTDKGFEFDNHIFKLDNEEGADIPVDGYYEPSTSLPIASSIDLRKFFTPVKNQGDMGACSAFAFVSVFESIIKKNTSTDVNLSEQFVYFNARRIQGNIALDSGSSASSVLKTMKAEGVCAEVEFPYNPDHPDEEPPKEAYDSALDNKIVKALAVKQDDIKAAISEGYPVVISLRIFDSFNPVKGLISNPEDDDIRSASGLHAMVICGYNDEYGYYVVRNSWGTKFGDNGYCYIPYSYIGNKELLRFAIIVTEISNTKFKVKSTDRDTVFSFDTTDSYIKAQILTNLIGLEKKKLEILKERDRTNSSKFASLFQAMGNNANRTSITNGTIKRLRLESETLDKKRANLDNERLRKLKIFDRETRNAKWLFGILIALAFFGLVMSCYFCKSLSPLTNKYILYSVYIPYALGTFYFLYYLRTRKRLRRELDRYYRNRIEDLAQESAQRIQESETAQLKGHLAGMIIDSLYKLNTNLRVKYDSMRSYIGNLRNWREDETMASKMDDIVKDPFLSVLTNRSLDDYYKQKEEEIIAGASLSSMFRDKYKVGEKEIVVFQNDLKKTIVALLEKQIKDFSILDYVAGNFRYDYLSTDLDEIHGWLKAMDKKSEPFVRLNSAPETTAVINSHIKLLFLHFSDDQARRDWDEKCSKYFTNRPSMCNQNSADRIVLVQLKGVPVSDISFTGNSN
ncbi:MAG: C1 family peptidase [Bacteroidales bacterium]|nr:C1 family peptidase [Bacteroidales bacterium]